MQMRSLAAPLLASAVLTASLTPTVGPAHAAEDAPPYTVIQRSDDRLIVQLPNRLIIVAQEVRTAPVVSAQVWIKTGSIYEQEHVGAGLSHFLEHLLAGGSTTNRSEAETNAILGRIGAQTNAFTSLDAVAYYINTTAEHAPVAIDLLSDWMINSTIPQEQYERERDVIQREFEFGMGSSGRIFWKLTQIARYQAHPARHPTIGYLDEFLTITRDEIYDFYKRMYVPNNMLFVVAGDIDKQAVVNQIATLWKDQKPGKLPDLKFPIEADIDQPRTVRGHAVIDRPQVRLAWPTVKLTEPGDYALDVLASVLGHGESSRLVRSIRDEQALVNTIDAYHSSMHWGEGFFGVDFEVALPPGADADTAQAAIDRVTAAVLAEIERIRDEGVTEEELARARRQTTVAVVLSAQTAQGMADRLARDIFATGDPDYLTRYTRELEKVTSKDVQAAAARFLQPNRQITVTLLPATKENPPTDVARVDDGIDPTAFRTEPVDLDNARLLERMRQLLRSESHQSKQVVVDEPRQYVLPNGLRLVVGRNTAVPAVAIQLYQAGGLLADEPGREGVAYATAAMQMKGTTTRTAAQIARTIEDLGASLSVEAGANSSYARAVALSEDWKTILDLVADVTLNPSFPESEWTGMQRRLLAAIDRQKDSWHGEVSMRFRQAYYPGHPWAYTPMGNRQVVAGLTADDLREFHRRNLAASQTVIAVFGDVDPDQVHRRVVELFGNMPAFSKGDRFVAPLPATPRPAVVTEHSDKPLAAVMIGFGPGVERAHPDYAAMRVLASVMSSFPSGWLEEQLRGQGPGLVYAVGAFPSTGLVPGHFAILFNTNPATAPEALRRAMSVVHRAKTQLVSDEDLARAKAAVLTEEFFGRQTNADLAANAALELLYGLGRDADARFRRTVDQLDATTLRTIAQTYLRNPIVVVLSRTPVSPETLQPALNPDTTETP